MQGATTTGRGRRSAPALFAVLLLPLGAAQAQSPQFEQCVLELIRNAASDVTVGEIRATCQEAAQAVAPAAPVAEPQPPTSAIDRRLALEGATGVVPFCSAMVSPAGFGCSTNASQDSAISSPGLVAA